MADGDLRRESQPPLPQFWEFTAPAGWRSIDFISDLHLQADQPRTVEAFAAHLRHTPADAVFILGDLFEAWVGDDARHDAFEASVGELLKEASAHRSLAFMAGNRDFLVGTAFLRECGVMLLPDPTVLRACGERLLLSHGDALCLEDHAYQRFRAEVRTDAWCSAFLARPLAERRALAAKMRAASIAHQRSTGGELWADIDASVAVRWMHEAGTPLLVHGHTHRPGDEALAPGFMRAVLSDWELDHAPPRAGVLRLRGGCLERVAPSPAPTAPRRGTTAAP
jgi:UDP-2,3-diacylglucosamine hydrolase